MASPRIDVGSCIRAFRKKRGLSLNDLSAMTGIAASNLSSIELNKSSPTLSTLVKIADAFNMAVGRLLDEMLYRKAFLCRRNEAPESDASTAGVPESSLTDEVVHGRMEAGLIVLESGAEPYVSRKSDTDRFLYCLAGELTVEVADEVYELETGESLYVLAGAPFILRNRSGHQGRLLTVYGPADSEAHCRPTWSCNRGL